MDGKGGEEVAATDPAVYCKRLWMSQTQVPKSSCSCGHRKWSRKRCRRPALGGFSTSSRLSALTFTRCLWRSEFFFHFSWLLVSDSPSTLRVGPLAQPSDTTDHKARVPAVESVSLSSKEAALIQVSTTPDSVSVTSQGAEAAMRARDVPRPRVMSRTSQRYYDV